jgi:hypothetical protein
MPGGLARLLDELLAADARDAVVTLVQRIIAQFEVTDAMGAAALLRALRMAGAGDITELARLAAGQVSLTDPDGAPGLLKMLAKLGSRGLPRTWPGAPPSRQCWTTRTTSPGCWMPSTAAAGARRCSVSAWNSSSSTWSGDPTSRTVTLAPSRAKIR